MAVPTPPIACGPQILGSLTEGVDREWVVPDGLGGYAAGTVSGLRTRRYHGLLTVSLGPPARRMMALVSLDPVVRLPSGAEVRLATHEWASGHLAPTGHRLLESFTLIDGVPRWRWRIGDTVLEREVATRHGATSVAVTHRLLAGPPVVLSLDPLCTWRDAHGERHADAGLRIDTAADGVVVEGAYRVSGPGFEPHGEWWHGVHAREEASRGLASTEDLFRAGRFVLALRPGEVMEVSAWAGDLDTPPPPAREVVTAARARARAVVAKAAPADGVAAMLALAADAFIVQGPHGPDVVAGYPWFGTWSRDTMISYEGLFLTTNRADEGRDLLRGYAATLSEGMCANTADTGRTEYNTADATLWFLHAVGRHIEATGDVDLAAELTGPLREVVDAHVRGTRYGIRIDPADGLLTQGGPGVALTWMDAVINGVAVTPRGGKAVELNALWVNGLGALAALHDRLGRDAGDLRALRERAVASFGRRFPAPGGGLHDIVDGPSGDDVSVRPNQLLAWGLPYAPLTGESGAGTVRAVGSALLTPVGLRTLPPQDASYRAVHRGGPADRDLAYHQGTVWPWLIGPYVDACTATGVPTDGVLDGLVAHLGEWGLGSVSETADADAPHAATGCPYQAWSVAEINRAYPRVKPFVTHR